MLHHQIGRRGVGHGVENRDHIGVLQPPDQGRLGGEEATLEMRLARVGDQTRANPLDRDLVAAERVVGEEDLAGRSLAELGQHAVLVDVRGQRGARRGSFGGGESGQGHGRAGMALAGTPVYLGRAA